VFERLRKRLREPQERASAGASAEPEPEPPEDDFAHAPDAEPEDLVGKKHGFYGNELPDRGPQSGWGGSTGSGGF
jgi:hypothetical protein